MTDPYEKYLKTGVKTPRERPKGTRMGRGHYKLIAKTLGEGVQCARDCYGLDEEGARYLFELFADALSETNPSFRRETFLAACGVSDES